MSSSPSTVAFRPAQLGHRRVKAAVAVAVAVASLAIFAHGDGSAKAASITIALPAARAPEMTSGWAPRDSLEPGVTGGEAQIINAALPTSQEPLQLARAFVLKGSAVDQRLALTCLAQAVYYEAGSQSLTGQRAVAQVVLNRLRHPSFPKSVCGVVYQGAESSACQFTFVCDGSLGRIPSERGWRDAEAVARAALSGYVEPSVGEATHYHADYVAPGWAPLLAKIGTIGQHIFYRFPGAPGTAAEFTGRYAGEPRDALTMRLAQATYGPMNGGADLGPAAHLSYAINDLLGASLASDEANRSNASVAPAVGAPAAQTGASLR